MKKFASIALAASLVMGTMLAAVVPARAMPVTNSPSTSASDIVLVQERGSRRNQDFDNGRRDWRERHHDRRHWRESRDRRWDRRSDRRRNWGDDRRYDDRRDYRPRRGGVIFEIRP
ncbi:hypothetical protein HB780_14850 [Rhizobium lusitanum]|uniref:hypothetical protein n=1 Tax=Rhizobium lusitanum TaxID=293958 RepID=UPI001620AC8D|nr:hypothetical protein [Rhizobium lusitanum]QND47010.1 hypothetical protein HB780_14850 [Rhizobium lusitanum]